MNDYDKEDGYKIIGLLFLLILIGLAYYLNENL